jgi:hypothetical protein
MDAILAPSNPQMANTSHRAGRLGFDSGMSLASIVDWPTAGAVLLKNCRSLAATDILLNRYASALEGLHPVGWLRPLIKPDEACVLLARAADKIPES